jgi:hypothetical protein
MWTLLFGREEEISHRLFCFNLREPEFWFALEFIFYTMACVGSLSGEIAGTRFFFMLE